MSRKTTKTSSKRVRRKTKPTTLTPDQKRIVALEERLKKLEKEVEKSKATEPLAPYKDWIKPDKLPPEPDDDFNPYRPYPRLFPWEIYPRPFYREYPKIYC